MHDEHPATQSLPNGAEPAYQSADRSAETDAERSARLRDPAAPAEMYEFLV